MKFEDRILETERAMGKIAGLPMEFRAVIGSPKRIPIRAGRGSSRILLGKCVEVLENRVKRNAGQRLR